MDTAPKKSRTRHSSARAGALDRRSAKRFAGKLSTNVGVWHRQTALLAETAQLRQGPDSEIATTTCQVCHSLDYITTQPPRLANPGAFWTAEVTKMKKVYGLKLEDADQARIIDYLSKTYR